MVIAAAQIEAIVEETRREFLIIRLQRDVQDKMEYLWGNFCPLFDVTTAGLIGRLGDHR